jgi:outer membrane protein OmpA-like peptidoglycan-associated protein
LKEQLSRAPGAEPDGEDGDVRTIIKWGGAVGMALVLAGCDLQGFGGPATVPSTGPPVTITQDTAPSALVAVLNGATFGPALSGLVGATAQLHEDLAVLHAGAPPETILSSASPASPTVTVAGRPTAPGEDETSYQAAQYARRLKHWREEVAAGHRTEAARISGALSAWLRGLGLQAKTARLADPPAAAGSLAAESAAATSALAGLEEETGNIFGGRRVIMLYTRDLAGRPARGELAGDTVLVVTPFLPTAAAASAAQADLLAAGAAEAAVVGPEVTGAQLAALVSSALNQGGRHESVSAPVLFANGSAALSPRAVAQLTTLLPQLRGTGVTAVINGFASKPGTALTNYTLSYDRAAMVAFFLESHGIPASSLIIVGHGASDLVAAGSSGQNRRVIVVIEKS